MPPRSSAALVDRAHSTAPVDSQGKWGRYPTVSRPLLGFGGVKNPNDGRETARLAALLACAVLVGAAVWLESMCRIDEDEQQ
jgi:predicted outer membrane lipoprotein